MKKWRDRKNAEVKRAQPRERLGFSTVLKVGQSIYNAFQCILT